MGTPLYLSPEAILTPAQIDGRADIYALGAVGYFLLTGTLLEDGQVLVAGGQDDDDGPSLTSAELYTPVAACSTPTVPEGTACDDGNPCTETDTCQSGACIRLPLPEGTLCDDGDACTQSNSCQAGACEGANPVVCAALDQCHVAAGTCDPATGLCSDLPAADGTLCDDDNPCTQTDACQSGACSGSNPVVCIASDACHVPGVCDPAGPTDDSWTAADSLGAGRLVHTATLLGDGKVLVVGGGNNSGSLASAELYDPATDTWTHAAPLGTELYDPVIDTWTAAEPLTPARYSHTATLLAGGKVLVAGGYNDGILASAELYDPVTDTWTAVEPLTPRAYHTATLLGDGGVLVGGGRGQTITHLASSELYTPVAACSMLPDPEGTACYDGNP